MDDLSLYTKINSLPSEFRQEVKDFVEFLRSKVEQQKKREGQRNFGVLKGKIILSEDFDSPIEDFEDYT